MQLSELPALIKKQSLTIQNLIESRDRLLTDKKQLDIEVERKVQSLDSKIVKNESQREIARFDCRTVYYNYLLNDIINVESDLALAKIELQYLQDMLAVAKLENEDLA